MCTDIKSWSKETVCETSQSISILLWTLPLSDAGSPQKCTSSVVSTLTSLHRDWIMQHYWDSQPTTKMKVMLQHYVGWNNCVLQYHNTICTLYDYRVASNVVIIKICHVPSWLRHAVIICCQKMEGKVEGTDQEIKKAFYSCRCLLWWTMQVT